jgi:hypothetical protein
MLEKLISKPKKPNLLKRILKRIRSYSFFEQWILLVTQNNTDKKPSWNDFKRLIPPPDRIWADPFIWIHEKEYYLFFEEMPTNTKLGRICSMTLDNDLNVLANEIVLERPYHLSYPFIFEYKGEIYMLPETGTNHSVEVYRCTQFPNRWELAQTLLSGVFAVDATLFEYKGKWWMFVNIAEEGGSTWDTLHLYYSDHPLSHNWTPHPNNPIVQDVRSARPAGHIFSQDGKIIRPSQDCSKRYGYATNFNIITKLNEIEYEESLEWKFLPRSKGILATHTWNRSGNLLAIDAILRRRKPK